MLSQLLKPEIEELISQRKWGDLREGLESWHPAEVAEFLLDIVKADRVLLYRALPRDFAADVFSEMESEDQEHLLIDLTDKETINLLADLAPDDRTELLTELPAKVTKTLINKLSPSDLQEARELMGYPEDSVGRLMTPDFVEVKENMTAQRALEHIRKHGRDSETIYRVYVRDEKGKLIDDILLRNIILAQEDTLISDLMDFEVISISAFEDQEEAVKYMEKYNLVALPVVDSIGQMVGIVTVDDILDVQEEEATEDFQKISGINPVEQSYISASVWKLFTKRFPWLLALLFANFITAAVITSYEHVTLTVVALASFIPLLIGTAGNSGTQSSTLIIRSLALGEIETNDWLKVLQKELAVGLFLGLILGLMTYFRGYLEGIDSLDVASVVAVSMITLIIWANIIGAILPMVLARFKLDPAVISSPLIATLIDVSGIWIYFNIAIWILDV